MGDEIAVEIVSEEEMALIESAFLSASNKYSSLSIHSNSKWRTLSTCSSRRKEEDIEDIGTSLRSSSKKYESLLDRFRRKRALSVTDIVASEWCEKKMEYGLARGKPKATDAMKAGTDRHAKLEQEVIQKVEVHVEEIEDSWALKIINFIVGANQLLFQGLTRELPLFGFVQGVWMVGVIDEIRLPATDSVLSPFLVENKTRYQATLPAEAQKRNGKLQLMCYKYMWDNIVTNSFPTSPFYVFFGLNAQYILSGEVQDLAAASGFPAKTIDDLVVYYMNTCSTLSIAQDELLIRYEFQGDHSLLGEEKFAYDNAWLLSQLKCSLDFWFGERQASYVSKEERWKCRFCNFAPICPNASMQSTPTRTKSE